MMKIEDFVAEIKANTGMIEEVCKKHIVKKYVPYLEKVTKCEHIVSTTMKNETGSFHQSTPSRFLVFTMTLIKNYTDLEINSEALWEEYDKLDEVGALMPLNAAMPQAEVGEFNTILAMAVEDYMTNNRSMVSYFDKYMDEIKNQVMAEQ